ncbi:unnamed protein product, partial [Meganyctiphanes norvegica]
MLCSFVVTYILSYLGSYMMNLKKRDFFFVVSAPLVPLASATRGHFSYDTYTIFFLNLLISDSPLYLPVKEFGSMVDIHRNLPIKKLCEFDKYHIGFITTMYFIPLIVICVLYMLILFRLWYGVNLGGSRSAESVRGKKRVTRMVVIVVVSFMICWLPIQIVLLLKSFQLYPMTTPNVFIQIASHVLAYTNSCINPILYAFLSDPFRKAFRKVISCGPGRRQTFAMNGRADGTRKSLETLPLHPRHGIHTFAVVRDEATSNFLSPLNPTNATTTTSFTNGGARDDSPPPYESLRQSSGGIATVTPLLPPPTCADIAAEAAATAHAIAIKTDFAASAPLVEPVSNEANGSI